MKSPLLIGLFALALLSVRGLSADAAQPRLINVSGSAELKVVPDEVYVRVGVETRHEEIVAAKKQNDERTAAVLAALRRSGVKDEDLRTDFLAVEPTYAGDLYVSSAKTRPTLFTARKGIEFKLTDMSKVEAVLTDLLVAGATHVHSVEFRTSQLRRHRDAARLMAVTAAKEKADALAAALGVKRGAVHSVNASEFGGWWRMGAGWGGMGPQSYQNVSARGGDEPGGADSATLSAGRITVSASVNVAFLIE